MEGGNDAGFRQKIYRLPPLPPTSPDFDVFMLCFFFDREREREREREKDTQTDRQTASQTDRQTDRQTDKLYIGKEIPRMMRPKTRPKPCLKRKRMGSIYVRF